MICVLPIHNIIVAKCAFLRLKNTQCLCTSTVACVVIRVEHENTNHNLNNVMIVHEIHVAIALEMNKQRARMIDNIVNEGRLSISIASWKSFHFSGWTNAWQRLYLSIQKGSWNTWVLVVLWLFAHGLASRPNLRQKWHVTVCTIPISLLYLLTQSPYSMSKLRWNGVRISFTIVFTEINQ